MARSSDSRPGRRHVGR